MSSTDTITITSDYGQFEFTEYNRSVDAGHVRKLKKLIKRQGLMQPISVTPDGYIIDGQHRFHACRELGIPIKYIVSDALRMSEVVELNNSSKPWTIADKVHSYAAQGKEDYIKLVNFHNDCVDMDKRISMRIAAMIAQGSASNASAVKRKMNLSRGTWEFREDYDVALKRLYSLGQFKRWDFYLRMSFVTAFLRCVRTMDDFNPSELLKRAESNPHLFVYAATAEEMLRVWENVYNFRRKNHKRFF